MKTAFPLCVLVLVAFVAMFADSTPKPELASMTNYGCVVQPNDKAHGTYAATIWAEHGEGNRDWKFLLSIHMGKKARLDCLKDCDKFMSDMQRAIQERARVK